MFNVVLMIGVLPVLLTVGDAADASFPTTTRIRQEVWSLLKQMRSVPSKLPGNAESVLQALVAGWTIPEREVFPKYIWPDLPAQAAAQTIGECKQQFLWSDRVSQAYIYNL